MLLKASRNSGVSSTTNKTPRKGNAGRVELFAERREDGVHVLCEDVGGYGKVRHLVDFGVVSPEELISMAVQLQGLANSQINTTRATAAQIETLLRPAQEEQAEAAPDTQAQVDQDGVEVLNVE